MYTLFYLLLNFYWYDTLVVLLTKQSLYIINCISKDVNVDFV